MGADRWTLPDLKRAMDWARMRNEQGIRCVMDVLGEYAIDDRQTHRFVWSYISLVDRIASEDLHASASIKLTSLGALFDQDLCADNLRRIVDRAEESGVGVEIDMEGRPLVDTTIKVALGAVGKGHALTLALQAYLNRSGEDLGILCDHGIRIRLVKGAYEGDTSDFHRIRQRFKELASDILERRTSFDVGTHDSELIEWSVTSASRSDIQFGFLKGLSERTKLRLVEDGWKVSEYVPFGEDERAYVLRRERYLKERRELGIPPAP